MKITAAGSADLRMVALKLFGRVKLLDGGGLEAWRVEDGGELRLCQSGGPGVSVACKHERR